MRGVPATTIHRILYTPVYDPEYERIAEWLTGQGERPEIEALGEEALDRAFVSYQTTYVGPRRVGLCGPARIGFHHRLEAARRAAGHRLCR